ncbi:hypothetical protein NIES30_13750 [Phormidium tenue NIES-30]|uniref:Uncharacterized protein n=1 Tax=Phormidium tenue NIES-30 TaxID=549789 RepID=A0A1U7J4M8_9CYAN|nr:hypothetical protein NIES30_13750 [Phormidium tenue NIES-30]
MLLLGASRSLLIDRKTSANSRWLTLDLDDSFFRSKTATFDQITTLLTQEILTLDSESTDLLGRLMLTFFCHR